MLTERRLSVCVFLPELKSGFRTLWIKILLHLFRHYDTTVATYATQIMFRGMFTISFLYFRTKAPASSTLVKPSEVNLLDQTVVQEHKRLLDKDRIVCLNRFV